MANAIAAITADASAEENHNRQNATDKIYGVIKLNNKLPIITPTSQRTDRPAVHIASQPARLSLAAALPLEIFLADKH